MVTTQRPGQNREGEERTLISALTTSNSASPSLEKVKRKMNCMYTVHCTMYSAVFHDSVSVYVLPSCNNHYKIIAEIPSQLE